jgi:pilus assembly protein Flp/PilA
MTAFFRGEDGATAIEYGLIAGLISVALIATVFVLGGGVEGLFNNGTAELFTQQAAKI